MLKPVNDFLDKIYNLIETSKAIRQEVEGVYLSINPNPLYPFVFIKICQIDDFSNYIKYRYELKLDILIFFRDKHTQKYLKIADMINQALDIKNFTLCDYKVLGLKKQNIIFDKSNDALTTKLTINYLTTIREK